MDVVDSWVGQNAVSMEIRVCASTMAIFFYTEPCEWNFDYPLEIIHATLDWTKEHSHKFLLLAAVLKA